MDPASLAVALIAPYLAKLGESFASSAGEAALEGTMSLLTAIRRKFTGDGDEYAKQTLERLEQRPNDDGRQSALKGVLEDKAQADNEFADELRQLVEATTGAQPVGNFLTQVYGGEVGRSST